MAKEKTARPCPACRTKPGDLHVPGCDIERCPRCGGQAIGCNCIYEVCGIDPNTMEEMLPELYDSGPTKAMEQVWDVTWGRRSLPWTGTMPGVVECREFGFWCVEGITLDPPMLGWVPVPAGTPGATEDLNTLYRKTVWDPDLKKRVLPCSSENSDS